MYLIAINKIIKCFLCLFYLLFLSVYLFFFTIFLLLPWSEHLLFFHSHYIFFSFFPLVFCYWVFKIYFLLPLLFCICFMLLLSHLSLRILLEAAFFSLWAFLYSKLGDRNTPFFPLLSHCGFTISKWFHRFFFLSFLSFLLLYPLSGYCLSWLKNPFLLHPQSSKCLLLCLPMMHHKNVCKLYASAIYT